MNVKIGFIAEGTTCESCATIIKKQVRKVKGVKKVTFDYSDEIGYVTFNDRMTDIDKILDKIEEKNFTCFVLDEDNQDNQDNSKKTYGWIAAILGLILIGYFLLGFIEGIELPSINHNMGYGLLFVVGLLTGFHCISMCGGFIVSYTAKNAQEGKTSHKSHVMYGVGKLISYTVIGAAFGLLGSLIAFTPLMRGVVGLFAGLFLILFGLKMLNIFPVLRKIQIKTPSFITKFVGIKSKEHSSPLMIGLLNGLMIACGPLQAIYIMAAGTGSLVEGAKLLFVFGLGTTPVLLGFGYFASFVSAKMTHKILKASGVIVIILGLFMLNNGLVLTGTGYDARTILTGFQASNNAESITGDIILESGIELKEGYQEITMEVMRSGWVPNKFVLKKGVPVRWKVIGTEITGCNNAIQVPKLGIEFDVKKGEQIIEFTPETEGVIPFSCWMGMIPGTFIVKDDIDINDAEKVQEELNQVTVPTGGSCGGSSGGGCGCGSR